MLSRMISAAASALLLVAVPCVAQRAKARMEPSPIGDQAGWITPDDYPAEAVRAGRQGRVVAELTIDAAGNVTGCKITTSSGTDSLDARTCEIALLRGHYNPATDRRGRAIAGTANFPVRWVLPTSDDGLPMPKSIDIADTAADVDFEVAVDPDGKVLSCRTIKQTFPGSPPDPCEKVRVGTESGQIFTQNGKPVGAIVRTTLHRTVTPVAR